MKKTIRLSALLLAVLTALALLASCAQTNDPETTTGAIVEPDNPDVTEKPTVDSNGYKLDDIPADLKFNGATVKILYWSDAERVEFEVEESELNGDIVKEAIYKRNLNTEDRLGVTFEWQSTKGANAYIGDFVKYTQNLYNGGDADRVDIIATYTRSAGSCSTAGLLKDMNSIDNSYINFNQPWWPERCYDTCTIGDSLFFCSGDISTNVLHFMYCIYYNIDMLKDYPELEDPVKYVDDKTWTIDKLIEMTRNIYLDNDNNGVTNYEDRYGFCSIDYGLDAFYTGSGLRLVDSDPTDILVISDDFTSQKASDLCDKLGTWLNSNCCFVDGSKKSMDSKSNYYPFVHGEALFAQNRVYLADSVSGSKLHEVEWQYGILPTPLYDENQENYITVVGNPFTLWAIMAGIDSERAEIATAVMEVMASEAYRNTTPALFETNMKYRYTAGADNDGVRMFDIIHNTIDFDLGRIYSKDLNYMSEMPSKCAATGNKWGSQMNTQAKALRKAVANKVVEPLKAVMGK